MSTLGHQVEFVDLSFQEVGGEGGVSTCHIRASPGGQGHLRCSEVPHPGISSWLCLLKPGVAADPLCA